jgi:CheY-like chemotaxis protein
MSPEIRQAIDQLQQQAWEARALLRTAQEEKAAFAARFEEAQRINAELRARLPESRGAVQAAPRTMEAEAKLLSLRQARDSAQSKVRELTEKLAQTEEELELLREHADSHRPVAVPSAPAADPALQAEIDALRTLHAALEGRIPQLEAELAEARQQAAQAAAAAPEALRLEIAAMQQQREEVLMQLEIVTKEVLGLRQQLAERTAEAEARKNELDEAARRHIELEVSVVPLREAQAAAKTNLDAALTSLASAQKQIERIMRERDTIREEAHQQNLLLEKEVAQKRAELAQLRLVVDKQEGAFKTSEELKQSLQRAEAERDELAQRFEKQRLHTIDLATRLEQEQQQIRQLSSSLAEARLQVKASSRRPEEPAPVRPEPAPEEVPTQEFDTALALDAIRAMRRCYHAFAKESEDFSHLNELHCQIHALAEHASATGFIALHRLVAAFDTFIQELYHFPEQITPASLLTVPETIEFLASLMKVKDLRSLKDPATATVYIVEDDALTCECITMAMETSLIRGLSSQDPAHATCELASTPCDLIFLDINMPGLDGFELCTTIRQQGLHRHTPVIFLSGMATPELRAKAALVGGSDFLAKPFILCELTLKALVHISKAHLHMA